jgi:hypothetical protein
MSDQHNTELKCRQCGHSASHHSNEGCDLDDCDFIKEEVWFCRTWSPADSAAKGSEGSRPDSKPH